MSVGDKSHQTVAPVLYHPEVEYSANWKMRPKIQTLRNALDVLEDIVVKFPWPEELHFNFQSFQENESKIVAKDIVWFTNEFREQLWKRRDEELQLKAQGMRLHKFTYPRKPGNFHIVPLLMYFDAVKPLKAMHHAKKSTYNIARTVPYCLLFGSMGVFNWILNEVPLNHYETPWILRTMKKLGFDDMYSIDAINFDIFPREIKCEYLKAFVAPRVFVDVQDINKTALERVVRDLDDVLMNPANDVSQARVLTHRIPIATLGRYASSVLKSYRADVATFLWAEFGGGVLNAHIMANIFWSTHKRHHELSMMAWSAVGMMPKNILLAGMQRLIPAWGPNAYPNQHRPLIEMKGNRVTQYFPNMKLPAPFEVTAGSPTYVENKEEFLLNFEAYSGLRRDEFPNLKKYGFVVAGGAIVASMLPLFPIGTSIEERRRFYKEHFPTADIDIFCTSTGLRRTENMEQAAIAYLTFLDFLCKSLLGGAPALVVCTSRLVNIIRGGDHPVIQLPLGDWVSTAEVAFFADIDCSGVVFDGEDVFFSSRSYYAWSTRTNFVCRDRVLYGVRGSPVYENRLLKYRTRGFIPVDIGSTAAESEAHYATYKKKNNREELNPSKELSTFGDGIDGSDTFISSNARSKTTRSGNVLLKTLEEEEGQGTRNKNIPSIHTAFVDLQFPDGIDVKTASLQDLADLFAKAPKGTKETSEYGLEHRKTELISTTYCENVVTYHPVKLTKFTTPTSFSPSIEVSMNGYNHANSISDIEKFLHLALRYHVNCEADLMITPDWLI